METNRTTNKKIVYVNRGVANSFDDRIEIHKKWQNYPLIEQELIKHELGHDSGRTTKKDLAIDFKSFVGFKSQMFLIFLITPSMWWQLSPFFLSSEDNQVYIDWVALFFWVVIFIAGGLAWIFTR